jgi:ankyrin repeat protein
VSSRLPIGPDASLRIRLGKKSANDVRLGIALVEAAAMGDLSKMKELIRRGASLNSAYALSQDTAACTPLMAAVCGGSKDAVEFLLENGAIADGLYTQDMLTVTTPLCLAAGRGDIELVRCLLDYGADINKRAQNNTGHAACHAARNGHTNILSLLIDRGANIYLQAAVEVDGDKGVSSTPLSTGNILAIGVYNDRLDTVNMLLAWSKIDVDYCDTSAALAMAAYQGNVAMIQLLLSKYPHLSAFNALWLADSQGHNTVVDAIIDHQQQVKQPMPLQSVRILKRAVKRSLKDLTSRMLSPRDDDSDLGNHDLCDEDLFACRYYEAKAAYNLVAQTHPTLASMAEFNLAMALNCAVYYGDLEAARVLLNAGLNVSAAIYPSNRRYLATNFSLAVRMGHFDLVDLFLDCGADATADGHLSLDLLDAALESRSVSVLCILFNTDTTFRTKRDEWSCSSFNAAVQRIVEAGYLDLLQALVEGGLDVNQSHIEDRSGRRTTLLHLAAYQVPDEGTFETVKLLLENGADPRIQVSSRTASDVVYSQCMGLEESDEGFPIAKRTIDLLEFWESRMSISGVGSGYSQKAM